LQDAKGSQQVASHSHGFDTQLQLKLFSIIIFSFFVLHFFRQQLEAFVVCACTSTAPALASITVAVTISVSLAVFILLLLLFLYL